MLNKKFSKFIIYLLNPILVILILSLLPWLEFINQNINQLDEIFSKNFYFLIILYLSVIIFIFFLVRIFLKNRTNLYYISLITFSVWFFFQYNLIKTFFFSALTGFYLWNFASEISLIIVLSLIFLTFIFFKKNYFLSIFSIFFLSINILYLTITLYPKLKIFHNENKQHLAFTEKKHYQKKKNASGNNVYFFILDAMKPLPEFERFYNIELNNFKKLYTEYNYLYLENTENSYEWTKEIFTSLFFLKEKIYLDNEIIQDNKILKSDVFNMFPTLLNKGYYSPLIKELYNLDYNFKWVGNYSLNCSKTNHDYCLDNNQIRIIDIYTLQAFLQKSPIIQILDNIFQLKFLNKIIDFKILHSDAISEIDNFISSNKNYKNNSTFFFIHDLQTHDPYFVDENCNSQLYPGKYNLEGYKNSYLCNIKKISKVIKTINYFDPNAAVVFQSDHNWIMSKQEGNEMGNRKKIFNLINKNLLCNNQIPINPNTTRLATYILECLQK